tara:strand:+ start:185 stop:502 length:318 start_codon:yes stop_codon:yes gene_type:complete
MYQKLLIQPLLTEKMAIMQERENKYAFIVDKNANKNQIKEAVEKKFDVLVSKVATMNIDGKLKQMTTRSNGKTIRTQGRRPSYKKTIITLKDGYTIDFVSRDTDS